jgi:endo-1,4-beta-xylanase
VDPRPLREDAGYARIVREQCTILVPENAMKWSRVQPAPARYTFEDADEIVAFAEKHKIKVRGHNLVWHNSMPDWLQTSLNPSNARQLMVDHIQTVASRYAGRMHSWDVVNEAISPKDGRADGLRLSPWLRNVGDDYIELAYRTARNADPNALLTYNDYGLDTETYESEQRRNATLLLLRRLRARNVPLDAIGIQAHLKPGEMQVYGNGLRRFLTACRNLDLQIFITELDVDDQLLPAAIDKRDAAIARVYSSYLNTVLPDPAVRAVLTWGFTDRYTWLNGEQYRADNLPPRPLLFDRNYRPKPSFAAVRDAFDHRKLLPATVQPTQSFDPIRPNPSRHL